MRYFKCHIFFLCLNVLDCKEQNQEQTRVIRQLVIGRVSSGNTYIRWGRTTCPPETGARVLYDGYVGGSYYSHTGGGSNYLCLPRDPELVNIVGGARSYVYGAEYETPVTDHKFAQLNDQEVPCVVCLTPHTNTVMIPAKATCHPGWILEYSGFLMTEYYQYHRRDYVCMDGDAEPLDDSYGNQNGALFHFVEGSCGSLPCGPYRNNYELTCAVCSLPPARINIEPLH